MSTFYERKIAKFFKSVFDTNGDNFITFDDFELSVEKCRVANNLKIDDPKIVGILASFKTLFNNLLALADTNNDGKISLDEFITYFKSVATKIKGGATLQELQLNDLAEFTFKGGDIDDDGVISKEDFMSIIKTSINANDHEIQKTWEKIATLGTLDRNTFIRSFAVYLSSDNEQDAENHLMGPLD